MGLLTLRISLRVLLMHQRSPVTLEQARGPVRLLVLTQTLKLILYRPLESNMPLK